MPSFGTHITIIERLAANNPEFQSYLGIPFTEPAGENEVSEDDAKKMAFAKLGALGPDIFYLLAERASDWQEMQNFLIKICGTFSCLSDLMEQIDSYVTGVKDIISAGVITDLEQTTGTILGIIKNSFLAALVDAGFSFFPYFEPQRQMDEPRERWWWAEYLHYVKTGEFVTNLLEASRQSGNQFLQAYALGYLTHYITDVIGHGYVNQIVEAPARLHWQRHHLVENYIDAYIWDRWHISMPDPEPPSIEEKPLDRLVSTPNSLVDLSKREKDGKAASLSNARLHDHIDIGSLTLDKQLDELVEKVAQKIRDRLFIFEAAEDTEVEELGEQDDFRAWTAMMADVICKTYEDRHPIRLRDKTQRPEGYLVPDDIAAAYGSLCLYLKLATEQKITTPKAPPPLQTSLSHEAQEMLDNLEENIKRLIDDGLPPIPPPIPPGSHLDLKDLFKQIEAIAKRIVEKTEEVLEVICQTVKDALDVLQAAAYEVIRPALYKLNLCLFAVFRAIRSPLVLNGYMAPFTDELLQTGIIDTFLLWHSRGSSDVYPL